MFTRTKKSFQLSLITIFATLLLLGTASLNTAFAGTRDTLEGKAVIKEQCDNGADKPTKQTIKTDVTMDIFKDADNREGTDACGAACLSPYPAWIDLWMDMPGFIRVIGLTYSGSVLPGKAGTALTKNLKSGKFHAFMDNVGGSDVGNLQLEITGTIVSNKKTGVTKKIAGKISGHDHTKFCTYVGKFKAKIVVP
jgi:hypothetical protein